MRLIYFHLLRFCTANQYLDLGVPLNQIDNAHDGIDCFLTASDPYVNSCSVHRGSISQVTVVNPIYEIRKPRMGRSLWSVDHDFRSVHQLIQCIPEILIIIIHLYILRQNWNLLKRFDVENNLLVLPVAVDVLVALKAQFFMQSDAGEIVCAHLIEHDPVSLAHS